MTEIHGNIAPGFQKLADAFEENFNTHGEVGSALCVYRYGKPVVDIWGGIADPSNNRAWDKNTIQLIFSAAKGITTTCMLMLAESGKLDLDAPIATYWPEFAANGKERITTRMVMTHRAGLAAVDGDLTMKQVLDWEPLINAIAAQGVNWEPDTAHGYHARTFGWIQGEVMRRITGLTVGQFLQQEICTPLDLNLWIGLPKSELNRCAKVIPSPSMVDIGKVLGEDSLTARVLSGPSNLFDYSDMWNAPEILLGEMPSSNAVADAHSLAKFYAAITGSISDNKPLLSSDMLATACEVASEGKDKVTLTPSTFGLGYALPPFLSPNVGQRSFGHTGAGGSVGFADPEANISFGYIANQMVFNPDGDPRTTNLFKKLYDCL